MVVISSGNFQLIQIPCKVGKMVNWYVIQTDQFIMFGRYPKCNILLISFQSIERWNIRLVDVLRNVLLKFSIFCEFSVVIFHYIISLLTKLENGLKIALCVCVCVCVCVCICVCVCVCVLMYSSVHSFMCAVTGVTLVIKKYI